MTRVVVLGVGFVGAAIAIPLATQAVVTTLSPLRVLVATLMLVLAFPLLFIVATLAFSGRRAVQALLLATWLSALPLLAHLSPPLSFHHPFNTGATPVGHGVTILAADGWTPSTDGLALDPGRRGTLLLEIRPSPLRALDLRAHLYGHWGSATVDNSLEFSSDGATYRPLGANLHLTGTALRLAGPGHFHPLRLRINAANPSPDLVLVVDDLRFTSSSLHPVVLAGFVAAGLFVSWAISRFTLLRTVALAAEGLQRVVVERRFARLGRRTRNKAILVLGLSGCLLLAYRVVASGPDFLSYARYLTVFTEGHLYQDGTVQVSVHAIGPALVWAPSAVPFAILQVRRGAEGGLLYAIVPNWLAFIALLLSQLRFLRRQGFAPDQIAVAMATAYFGTPLVFYGIFSVASEMLSAVSVWVIFRRLYENRLAGWRNWTTLGALCGLSILIRPNNALLVLLILPALALRQLGREPWRIWLPRLGLLGLACFFATLPVLTVNAVFLGSPFRNAYSHRLSSGEYLWFDFTDPKPFEILFSHWHGLLIYSPIYLLVGIAAGLWLRADVRKIRAEGETFGRLWDRSPTEIAPYLFGLYFLAHFYVVSVSRVWWMGTGTFGGRQFINFAPFAPLALAYILQVTTTSRWRHLFVVLSLASGLWTFQLMLARETNFTLSYAQVWNTQLSTLADRLAFPAIPIAAATAAVAVAGVVRFRAPAWHWLPSVTALVWAGQLYLSLVVNLPAARGVEPRLLLVIALLTTVGVAVLVRFIWHGNPSGRLATVLATFWFLLVVALPIRAGLGTAVRLSTQPESARRDFGAYLASLRESLREYDQISGYTREKAAWKQVVDRFERSLER